MLCNVLFIVILVFHYTLILIIFLIQLFTFHSCSLKLVFELSFILFNFRNIQFFEFGLHFYNFTNKQLIITIIKFINIQ